MFPCMIFSFYTIFYFFIKTHIASYKKTGFKRTNPAKIKKEKKKRNYSGWSWNTFRLGIPSIDGLVSLVLLDSLVS